MMNLGSTASARAIPTVAAVLRKIRGDSEFHDLGLNQQFSTNHLRAGCVPFRFCQSVDIDPFSNDIANFHSRIQ